MNRSGFTQIQRCRICLGTSLEPVLHLGEQMLTGVFPKSRADKVTVGPLELVRCTSPGGCGLLQLAHSYDLGEMYGDNYGYRSGLNPSMVRHLHGKVERILDRMQLRPGDLVLDVGSNDGTTLAAYPKALGADLLGIDPTAAKFQRFYLPHIDLSPEFFSAKALARLRPGRKVRVLTSFSMFYDLEAPMTFVQDVHDVLADDGIWVFEQSYMPAMLQAVSYDTVCHEHLEYYALAQIKWMADRVGMTLVDVEFNSVNGGSFSVTARRAAAGVLESELVSRVIEREQALGLDGPTPYLQFARATSDSRSQLRSFIAKAKAEGKRLAALGASTKGNVLLQYCGLTSRDLEAIGEVNPDKFGRLTPGSFIPIIPEDELLARPIDYLIVLPWHFRANFLSNPKYRNRMLVFPLPEVTAIMADGHSG